MTTYPGRVLPLVGSRAVVLRAVLTLTRPTVRSVALAAGIGTGTAYDRLRDLERLGFIAWPDHEAGTLRPLYRAHRPDEGLARCAAADEDGHTTTPEGTQHDA